jgi:hypothetical protein
MDYNGINDITTSYVMAIIHEVIIPYIKVRSLVSEWPTDSAGSLSSIS